MTSLDSKRPTTTTDVHPLILKRWSALSFSDKMIADEQINELFEAASWAASAFNEQPWQYIYATRGTEGFDKLWSCLLPGNQPWTKSASVLFISLKKETFSSNGNPNLSAAHDVGMANAQLLLQAAHRDIYGHLMAGIDRDKITEMFELDENTSIVCMGALGYLGDADNLEALGGSYKTRELSKRSRKPVQAFTIKI